jgi:diphosphomevalonate decarboxylase
MDTQNIVRYTSPSNIALIKYWGKYGRQYPRNASISLTLDSAYSDTSVAFTEREKAGDSVSIEFYFEEEANAAFQKKLEKYLNSIVDEVSFLRTHHLVIRSSNSFPHSAGIASSASAMSAVAMCLCQIEKRIGKGYSDESSMLRKASHLARLGSGSACRSVYPVAAVWGTHPGIAASSNDYAIPYAAELDPVFQSYKNDILIISRKEKSVSSTQGHALMEDNVYAASRYAQAEERMTRLLAAMKAGDVEVFGEIVEGEALSLHAMMMAANDPFILLQPNTLAAISLIQKYRQENKVPLYFSLDAGPNPHLLYPAQYTSQVKAFISSDLQPLCHEGMVIADGVGQGPKLLL